MWFDKYTKRNNIGEAMSAHDAKPYTHPVAAERNVAVRALRPLKKDVKYLTARFDKAGVERVALLRARLNLDNSALLNRAVSELYRRCIDVELGKPACPTTEE
jgi:hypothetical protein